MRLGHSSKNYAKAFFAFAAVGLMSACADNSVAPVEQAPVAFKAPAAYSTQVGTATFTVNNSTGGVFRLGNHVIAIPAGAICSLTSSYGATEWNKPCTRLSGSVTIKATMMKDDENHPYVDFQPAMRFSPDKEVMLFLKNGFSRNATELGLAYCDNLGNCVDESLNDASLAPFRVGRSSYLGRRLKHFSGYSVTAGRGCIGILTDLGDGWICLNEGLLRKSGYMVASGFKEDDKDKDRDHFQK